MYLKSDFHITGQLMETYPSTENCLCPLKKTTYLIYPAIV